MQKLYLYLLFFFSLSVFSQNNKFKVKNTGINMTIAILTVDTTISVGDTIVTFYKKEESSDNQISTRTIHPDISNPFLSPDDFFIAGWTIWEGERLAITLWGDDSTSEMKDGFSNNEFIHWGVFKENINYPFLRPSPVKLIYRVGKNQWQPNGISIIDSLKIDLTKSWCFE